MTDKRLLIVDDALIIREMIKDVVVADGWSVVAEGSDGNEAVELYREHRPDVVTLDLVMPEYDGLHALREIMASDPAARVLVVSAIDQSDVLKQAIRIGAADFIVKPFDNDRLRTALGQLLAKPAPMAP